MSAVGQTAGELGAGRDRVEAKLKELKAAQRKIGPSPQLKRSRITEDRARAFQQLEDLSVALVKFGHHASKSLGERIVSRVEFDERLAECRSQVAVDLNQNLELVLKALRAVEAMGQSLGAGLDRVHELAADLECLIHENSLTGYGDALLASPMAPGEADTSPGGDIVRDGTDRTPGTRTPVADVGASGAAASEGSPSRPHPHTHPTTEREVDDDR